MHSQKKTLLKQAGVNPCLFPLIDKKYAELLVLRKRLASAIELSSFDTKSGDLADRASFEAEIKTRTMHSKSLQLQIRKMTALLDVLEDPTYDGYCTVCEGNLLLSRIDKVNSAICIHCARRAEN